MNYGAFTNDSIAMMYEAVEAHWLQIMPLSAKAMKLDSVSAKRRNGRNTQPT